MVATDIEKIYNSYKSNLYEIRHIEKTIFAESYDYQKWETALREKSHVLRAIYEQNEKLLNEELRSVYSSGEEVDDELVTALLQHIMYFIYEDHYDYELTEKVLNHLEPYIETKAQDWQKIKFYYIRGLIIAKGISNDLTYPWYEKISAVCDDWTKADRTGSKERLLDAYLYRVMCLGAYENADCELFFQSLEEAKKQWMKKEVPELLSTIYGKDMSHYIKMRLELLDYMQIFMVTEENLENMSEDRICALRQYIEREYKKGVLERRLNCNIFLSYHRLNLLLGDIAEAEYAKALDLFMKPSPYEYPDDMNFEMRRDDLFACLEFNRYFCNSFVYAMSLLPEKLKYATDADKKEEIYRELEQYVCGLSTMENGVYMDILLVEIMKVIATKMDETKVFRLLESIMLHRQLPTAIHLAMVSKLVHIYVKHILEVKPELLVGLAGTTSVEMVKENRDKIIDFSVKAGLCHDIGKILSTDIINLQSRRITDEEFGMIKWHPLAGKNIADEIPAFKPYADIIVGHHLFADRKGGYPQEFDLSNTANKTIIDLITICDSVDAATDILGRNYTKGKDFKKILEELKQQSGTRYDKELVDILENSEELKQEMASLTGEKRALVYHDLYTRRVKPLALDKKYVERSFSVCKPEDKERVTKFIRAQIGDEGQWIEDNYDLYEEKYLVKNVENELIGIFFGKRSVLEKKDAVSIEVLLVKESSRHAGIGRRILFYVEEELRGKGYSYVTYKVQNELGVVERFMWINGYKNDNNEILKKQIN